MSNQKHTITQDVVGMRQVVMEDRIITPFMVRLALGALEHESS
jgi:hypothetical protein